LRNARLANEGLIPPDSMKESVGLQLDMINILVCQSSNQLPIDPFDVPFQHSPCAGSWNAAKKKVN
jgi:hypothetical protein